VVGESRSDRYAHWDVLDVPQTVMREGELI
jgi:hypothetical protein